MGIVWGILKLIPIPCTPATPPNSLGEVWVTSSNGNPLWFSLLLRKIQIWVGREFEKILSNHQKSSLPLISRSPPLTSNCFDFQWMGLFREFLLTQKALARHFLFTRLKITQANAKSNQGLHNFFAALYIGILTVRLT